MPDSLEPGARAARVEDVTSVGARPFPQVERVAAVREILNPGACW
jgi:hypothetical protein